MRETRGAEEVVVFSGGFPARRTLALPRILYHFGPHYDIEECGFTYDGMETPLPEGFQSGLQTHEDLYEEIVSLLADYTVAECHSRTLAPIETIETITSTLLAYQREAVWHDGARPNCFSLNTLELEAGDGTVEEVLHVAAINVRTGSCWTLAILDWSDHPADFSNDLIESLFAVMPPDSIVVTAFGFDELDQEVAYRATEILRDRLPNQNISVEMDWLDRPLAADGAVFGPAVGRLVDGLFSTWSEAELTVAELEQRVLVRQGYRAVASSLRCNAAIHRSSCEEDRDTLQSA